MTGIELAKRRYRIKSDIEAALIRIIWNQPGVNHADAKEIFYEWCEEEDGETALANLINNIIH